MNDREKDQMQTDIMFALIFITVSLVFLDYHVERIVNILTELK